MKRYKTKTERDSMVTCIVALWYVVARLCLRLLDSVCDDNVIARL